MISIIVPVYNVKDYVRNCLDSILGQTYRNIEIIIVDDGSSDGTDVIVDEYAAKYDRIRVFHKENGGLMSAWTFGVRQSKGEYIGFVDSDDAVEPAMFEKLLGCTLSTGADIVWCDFKTSDGKEYTFSFDGGFYGEERIELVHSHIFPIPGRSMISNARWNKLYKREIIINNLQYTECLSRTFEDRYIVPAALLSAKSFYYLKEPLYVYTLDREGCNSNKYMDTLLEEMKRMYNIQGMALKDKGKFEDYGTLWEQLFIDCIRVYVGRNVLKVKDFAKKIESCKVLLNDPLAKERIDKYGNLMTDKLLSTVKLSHRLHCPLILALASCLVSKKG